MHRKQDSMYISFRDLSKDQGSTRFKQKPTAARSPESPQQQPTSDYPLSPTLIPSFLIDSAQPELAPEACQRSHFDGQSTMINWSPELLLQMNEQFNSSVNISSEKIGWYPSSSEQNGKTGNLTVDDFNLIEVPLDTDLASSGCIEQTNVCETDIIDDPITSSELSVRPTPPDPKSTDYSQQQGEYSVDVANNSACTCLTDVVAVLEKLEILSHQGRQISLSSMGGTLSLNKNAMARCNTMLDCPTCQCLSSAVMILILIGRHLVSQFDRLSTNNIFHDTNNLSIPPSAHSTQCGNGAETNVWLGDYSVDTPEEWKEMLHALAIIQVKSLGSFLRRMRAAISHTNWTTHQSILETIESQYLIVMGSMIQGGQSE
ncbi:hypothetical protein FHL15_001230 [Xylaria flabelliformis]|uniref:Aflatoxin regulatory protein domain-containing protein n=1 Tax=Xylaria flabelliformis TaxID=2512241 RepID=A0A553ICU9_9PEZI|nr:hypothetical protein FHL15_001230 [Xylaria flabelliformis]